MIIGKSIRKEIRIHMSQLRYSDDGIHPFLNGLVNLQIRGDIARAIWSPVENTRIEI